ncbi:MAG: S8 family serine peptidase [Acidobacteriota bacterium]
MQERLARSQWVINILCAGALLAAPVLAFAGSAPAPLGKSAPVSTMKSGGTLDENPAPPKTVPSYPRTVAWWPFTSGPYYGAVDSRHDRDNDVIYTAVGSFKAGQSLPIPAELTVAADPAKYGRLSQYFLVQLRPSALETDFWGTLTSMGASIVEQVPVNALVVRANAATFSLLNSSPLVQHIEPYQPAYKLHPGIGSMPQVSPEAAASPIFTLGVRVFPGEPINDVLAAARKLGVEVVTAVPGVDSTNPGWVTLRAHASLVSRLAMIEGVALITEENPIKLMSTRGALFMQSATASPGDYPYWKAGLDGDNVVVQGTDSGMSVDAGDITDTKASSGWTGGGGGAGCNVLSDHRKVRCYRVASDYGGAGDFQSCDSGSTGGFAHGQLTSGLMIGNGTRGAVPASTAPSPTDSPDSTYVRSYGAPGWFQDNDRDGFFNEINDNGYDGIAKGGRIVFVDANASCPESVFSGVNVGNLQTTIENTWDSYDASIHNFSFGSDASTSTGAIYGSGASQIDTALINKPINFVAISAGNAGVDEGQSGAIGNIGNEASCKNCVSVGASNGIGGIWGFSSHGPAQNSPNNNKRVAPVLMGEGVDDGCRAEEGTGNPENQTGASTCFFQQSSGTSFSAPNIAGAAAVIREYFANGFYPDGSDTNSTNNADKVAAISNRMLKALMIVGTRPMTGSGGPFRQTRFNNVWGYGQFLLTRALPLADAPQTVPGLVVCDDPGNIDKVAGNDGVCSLSGLGTISTTVGETQTSDFQVLDAKTDLGVAVVWDDPSGANLVNDLDVEVWYCGANQTCSATSTPDVDDRVFQGNNFSEDYDRDGTTFDDLDADASIDGYYYSISTKRITDAGKVPANWRDSANNSEAVFIPIFNNAPDRNANGVPDIDALSDDALGVVNPKTGKWQVRVIRRSGTTNSLKYAVAIAGPVTAGSSARFDANPISCNGDVGVIVAEIADAGDTACPNPATCPASTIASRTVVDVLNAADVVVDTQNGLTFTQALSGATQLFRYESNQLPLTSTGTATNNDGVLNVNNGFKLRVTYTDQPGAKTRTATAQVDCQPDLVLLRSFILGLDSFIDLSDGCDLDRYLDAGEVFTLSIDYYNADLGDLLDATIGLKAVVPDGDNSTDECRNNNAASSNLTILDGTRNMGRIPGQFFESTAFSLRVNGTPAPRTSVDLVFSLAGTKTGQSVQDCVGVSVLLQADDEKHEFITDCPTGCTLNYDRNNDEKNENKIARNPFDVFDIAHRGLDETSVVFESMIPNNNASGCADCGNPGFAGVWDFDANDEGFRSGISAQSKLSTTALPISNWGEDKNWNNVLDAGEDQNSNGTLNQNWALGGGCGFMTANGTNRGIWHTGTIGTYATSDDTTACRPNDTKCEQYDQMGGTTAATYWFETLRTPIVHPTRFGNDPDGFKWRTQILDWSWNAQLDFPASDGYGLINADLDLDTADNNVVLGDDLVQGGGFSIGNVGVTGGGQNNIYGGAFVFAGTNQKNEANYGDNKVTARGGNRAGRRGCWFNDLNLIPEQGAAAGGKTAAERPLNTPKPLDDDCDNDYSLGPNGCPGNCGVDDDGNGIVDDFREICPCFRCNGGPRNLAACNGPADCNPDGSLTNPCADATGTSKAAAFTGLDGVPVGEADDVCGDGSIDEGVAATFGTSTTLRQNRNMRIDGDANGIGAVGTPVGNIRFNTLEDFYGEFVGSSWQGEIGFVVFEGTGEQPKQGYGAGIDDVVLEWMEVKPVAQAGAACSGPNFDGQCANISMASQFDTLDGDTEIQVTVVDPFPTGNLVDCNGDSSVNDVSIDAWSEAESIPESFCLVQTGAGTNTFVGTIRTTTRINKGGDKLVYLAINGADNPSVSARYIDKNDGVRGVDNGPDGQPGIAGFDDDGVGGIDNAGELCPNTTTLATGRSPHQPGQKARYSDDNCGCLDNPLVAVTLARFDAADVVVADVIVRDTNVAGTGNGDNDGWADPGEVVNVDLVLKNYSNFPINNATLTVATDSPNVQCVLDNEIRNFNIPPRTPLTGTPGVYDTSAGTDHIAFKGALVTRANVNDELSSVWTVALQGLAKGGPQYAIAADVRIFGTRIAQSFKIVHNLSASGVTAGADFFDNFESYTTDSAMLNSWPRFNTGDDPAELEGTRCQTNDPSNPFGNNVDVNFFCELGEGFNNKENHWHLHAARANACDTDGTTCENGGRSVQRPDSGCTGCKQSLSSTNTAEGDETAFIGDDKTMDVNRMTWVETQNSVQLGNGSPELTYWTQMSLQDNRLAGLPRDWGVTVGLAYICIDKNGNNDCDTAETGLKNSTENWEPLRSYFNPEQAFRRNNFINCSYDPSDDGNNENQFFANQLDVGPSSTCFPTSVNNCLARTSFDRDTPFGTTAADVGTGCFPETSVLDDPNIVSAGFGGNAGGNWLQKKYNLKAYRGRKVLVRFHISPFGWPGIERWSQFTGIGNQDDGWFIDDVRLTGVASALTLAVDNADKGGAACPATNCSAVTAKAAALENPRNDKNGNPKPAKACTSAVLADCDFNSDGTVDTASTTAASAAAGHAFFLDGSASSADRCLNGTLEYKWSVGATVVRDFLTDPQVLVNPDVDTTYTLTVRCSSALACTGTQNITVDVPGGPPGCSLTTNSIGFTGKTQINWVGSGTFDAVRGNCSEFQSTPTWSTATCLANDTPTTSATDAVTPAPGQGFYYLVRCAVAGTYNDGTQTGSRTPTACP